MARKLNPAEMERFLEDQRDVYKLRVISLVEQMRQRRGQMDQHYSERSQDDLVQTRQAVELAHQAHQSLEDKLGEGVTLEDFQRAVRDQHADGAEFLQLMHVQHEELQSLHHRQQAQMAELHRRHMQNLVREQEAESQALLRRWYRVEEGDQADPADEEAEATGDRGEGPGLQDDGADDRDDGSDSSKGEATGGRREGPGLQGDEADNRDDGSDDSEGEATGGRREGPGLQDDGADNRDDVSDGSKGEATGGRREGPGLQDDGADDGDDGSDGSKGKATGGKGEGPDLQDDGDDDIDGSSQTGVKEGGAKGTDFEGERISDVEKGSYDRNRESYAVGERGKEAEDEGHEDNQAEATREGINLTDEGGDLSREEKVDLMNIVADIKDEGRHQEGAGIAEEDKENGPTSGFQHLHPSVGFQRAFLPDFKSDLPHDPTVQEEVQQIIAQLNAEHRYMVMTENIRQAVQTMKSNSVACGLGNPQALLTIPVNTTHNEQGDQDRNLLSASQTGISVDEGEKPRPWKGAPSDKENQSRASQPLGDATNQTGRQDKKDASHKRQRHQENLGIVKEKGLDKDIAEIKTHVTDHAKGDNKENMARVAMVPPMLAREEASGLEGGPDDETGTAGARGSMESGMESDED